MSKVIDVIVNPEEGNAEAEELRVERNGILKREHLNLKALS